MSQYFPYDVFLSHSSKDKATVREVAERLKSDGVRVWLDEWEIKPEDSIPAKIDEGLAQSRLILFFISEHSLGSDWSQLEFQTFPFRDPLNKEKRFISLCIKKIAFKQALKQFPLVDWTSSDRDQEYGKLFELCRPIALSVSAEPKGLRRKAQERRVGCVETSGQATTLSESDFCSTGQNIYPLYRLRGHRSGVLALALSEDCKMLVSGYADGRIKIWMLETGELVRSLKGPQEGVRELAIGGGGEILYSACSDGNVWVWDLRTGKNTSILRGHSGEIHALALSADGRLLFSGSRDGTIRVWDTRWGTCKNILKYKKVWINSIGLLPGGKTIFAASEDGWISRWDVLNAKFDMLPRMHSRWIWSIALSRDGSRMISGSADLTLGVWEPVSGQFMHALEGHADMVSKVAISDGGRWGVSGSLDRTARVWDLDLKVASAVLKGHGNAVQSVCISEVGQMIVTGDDDGVVAVWRADLESGAGLNERLDNYVNAKILVVGDTNSGKTGLTHRLAAAEWKPSDESTVGAWSTQWKLEDTTAKDGVEREVWLWDFGGQADQRLIHQLYMDRSALILLLFNADQEDVLPGLRDWQTALKRCVSDEVRRFLVAGRIDTGFKASREKLKRFAAESGLEYHETSAKEGTGCDGLREAMMAAIPWDELGKRTSPRVFKLIKDEILRLRDEGQVLHTFKELRELLWRRITDEPRFTDETLKTVIRLLDGPGVVKELDYGTYVLLAPEWINAYGQAVIRTLRASDNELGVLPLKSIAEGKLIYQSIGREGEATEMKRLEAAEERVVLGELERLLEERGLCVRQGDKLVFPSHCGRDRPEASEHPSVFVSYSVKGFLDEIYATLVVKLENSEAFKLAELWRDAADFATLGGEGKMGVKLRRESSSHGEISIYFGKGVDEREQVIFANYIHGHLEKAAEEAMRWRHYVCPHCLTAKGNPQVLMERLLEDRERADTECDRCRKRFLLWDALEKKFASAEVRAAVEKLEAEDVVLSDSRRKGKLLVLEVGTRITSANQKWMEIPQEEDDGIDIQLEFTDENGNGLGKGLCLQLKAGFSHLNKRKTDGKEIFTIKKPRWVKTWTSQPHPVMLVVGTFAEKDPRGGGKEKIEFADIRWMEISSVLRKLSEGATKPVKQFEFKGERLDMTSVRRMRDAVLSGRL